MTPEDLARLDGLLTNVYLSLAQGAAIFKLPSLHTALRDLASARNIVAEARTPATAPPPPAEPAARTRKAPAPRSVHTYTLNDGTTIPLCPAHRDLVADRVVNG